MRRIILPASGEHFYKESNFCKFIESYDGVERLNHSVFVDESGKTFVSNYHIEPQGVTLTYLLKEKGNYRGVEIILAGKDSKVGEVEKIIHDGEMKYKEI